MSKFELDLKAFADKTNAKANVVVRKIVFDVDSSLVFKSPVGNPELWKHPAPKGYVGGRFRANWQYGENSINDAIIDGVDPTGQASINRCASSVGFEAAGKVHYLTNSLPYAQRLEDGWSTQAPAGMVGLTVIEFISIVKNAALAMDLSTFGADFSGGFEI